MTTPLADWQEVADGVWVRRYAELDLTVGLVVGEQRCLVIDTRGDAVQGAELAAAVRELTPLPWAVAITHAHFDHAFGTSAFGPCEVWAQEGCRATLVAEGAASRAAWARRYRDEGKPEIADAIAATELVFPQRLVAREAELSLGGRRVRLAHFGPGHTGHDLVVHVPDVAVVFAGDLLERGPEDTYTEESFGRDTVLESWPAALDGIRALRPRVVVPGHGDPAGPGFLDRQRRVLGELAALRAGVAAGELSPQEALARSPLPEPVTRSALAGAAGFSRT
ncbi:MBL fold metallo-hydrolase [Amycolatopsis anabasis]|uniref:MBL fold metallo-hydrolase n=1 Tax=Amycolatopsis anabasis TaxID=1840409 RepID=UPI00131CCD42|nr:MBL fold metallo-hydrolase [Amycolatopsis anabasis]